jgi:hypothetical protein
MLARFLPDACSCAVLVLCTASVACCWCSLASGLPSPPGSALSLTFTSWTCYWLLLVLLLLIWAAGSSPPGLVLSFNWPPWFCWMCLSDDLQELVLFLVWGARTLMCLRWCSAGSVCVLLPLVLFIRSTASFASSCGAASTSFSCSD